MQMGSLESEERVRKRKGKEERNRKKEKKTDLIKCGQYFYYFCTSK